MHTAQVNVGRSTLTIETGKLAKQADGAVTVRYGDTIVIVTACASPGAREGIDFLPLTVDYREYAYASGRIPGGFFKREGKPTEKEVLTSRLIDRPIRPLFPEGWNRETQVVALLLSADPENDSDVLALTGASAALAISSIPFAQPVAAVRVGQANGEFLVNPTFPERQASELDLIVAGSRDAIVMVEAGANEVSEEVMLGALEAGHAAIRQIVAAIEEMATAVGKPKTRVEPRTIDPTLAGEVEATALAPLAEAMRVTDKLESYAQVDQVQHDLLASIPEEAAEKRAAAKALFKSLKERVLRDEVLDRGHRLDGRAFDQVRDIWSEVGILPRVHGSAVFTRGETQALRHARHVRRSAEGGAGGWRALQALHAPLQLPAVLGRRGEVPARPGPARDRPWPSGGAEPHADAPERGGLPLHDPGGLRNPGIERVVVDGKRLRRRARPDGRRRAAYASGRRDRDGADP